MLCDQRLTRQSLGHSRPTLGRSKQFWGMRTAAKETLHFSKCRAVLLSSQVPSGAKLGGATLATLITVVPCTCARSTRSCQSSLQYTWHRMISREWPKHGLNTASKFLLQLWCAGASWCPARALQAASVRCLLIIVGLLPPRVLPTP